MMDIIKQLLLSSTVTVLDIDINQISGTCPQGITSCKGIVTLDVTSDNATIQINQKDNAGDS